MWLARRISLVSAVALTIGCASPAPGTLGRGIIGGALDTGDPAVVLLVSFPQDRSVLDTCTATVIAPTVLLTAAHCVDAATHPGYVFGAYLGYDASAYAAPSDIEPHLVLASSVVPHPGYQTTPPFTADVALVILSAPVAVTPVPLMRSAPTALVSQPARIVGYGQTVYGTFNAVKHAGATTIAAIDSGDTVTVGDAAVHSCIGDSGGPALASVGGVETLVASNSYSDTTGCTDPAHYRRVDLYLSFIDPYLPAQDGGTADGGPADAGAHDGSTPDGDAPDTARADTAPEAASGTDGARADAEVPGGSGGGCAAGGPARGDAPAAVGLLALLAATALRRVRRRTAA
jgi:V8-like Glu-specific endopeptidase